MHNVLHPGAEDYPMIGKTLEDGFAASKCLCICTCMHNYKQLLPCFLPVFPPFFPFFSASAPAPTPPIDFKLGQGIKVGLVLLAVNDATTKGKTGHEVHDTIRAINPGEKVKLTLQHGQ